LYNYAEEIVYYPEKRVRNYYFRSIKNLITPGIMGYNNSTELQRAIGLPQATALVVGITIGSSIFVIF
jgi:hypothetical protein